MVELRRLVLRYIAGITRFCDRRSVSTASVRRILLCATGGVGNTVLLAPLLKTLKRRLPSARIDLLLTNRTAADLAGALGWADEILCVREMDWYAGPSPLRMFGGRLRRRSYDAVLRTYLTAPSMARASLAAYLSGARIRVAYGEPRINAFETEVLALDETRSEIERHLALATALGLEPISEWGGLEVPERGRMWAESFLASHGCDARTPMLGIHPGSDGTFIAKRWRADRFGQLASLAAERLMVRPIVLGGPDDAEVIAQVLGSAAPGLIAATGQDIVQTAGLIERCSIFVSNDSGLMHLASALQVPTVAVFGPTDPVKNRPLGRQTRLVRLGLDCSPCTKEMARFLCGHHDCLERLSVEKVFEELERVLRVDRRPAGKVSEETRLSATASGERP